MNLREELEIVENMLKIYREAEVAILVHSQAYTIGSTQLTRANLSQVIAERKRLEQKRDEILAKITGRGTRQSLRFIPQDL